MTKRIALFVCAAFSAFALLASTNGVPFMTQHRNMIPTVSVTTNLYGSVTGVVDKAYVEGMAFATTNYVNDKIASIPVGTDTNAVNSIIAQAVDTNWLCSVESAKAMTNNVMTLAKNAFIVGEKKDEWGNEKTYVKLCDISTTSGWSYRAGWHPSLLQLHGTNEYPNGDSHAIGLAYHEGDGGKKYARYAIYVEDLGAMYYLDTHDGQTVVEHMLLDNDSYLEWYNVVDTPSTLDGYGIEDAYTMTEADNKYQPILVSGTNIKTVNGKSLLGTGNISIQSGSSDRITNATNVITANGEWLTKTNATLWKTNNLCTVAAAQAKADAAQSAAIGDAVGKYLKLDGSSTMAGIINFSNTLHGDAITYGDNALIEVGVEGYAKPNWFNGGSQYATEANSLSMKLYGSMPNGKVYGNSEGDIVFEHRNGAKSNLIPDNSSVVTKNMVDEKLEEIGYVTNNVLRGGQVRAITTNGATNEYFKLVPNYANSPYIVYEKYTNGAQTTEYNYRLPKKSGTIALNTKTSAAREAVDDQLGDLYDRSDNINATVNGWENYWSGDKVRLSVTNYYGNTSGELPRLRIEEFDHATTTVVDNVQYVTNFYKTVWDEESRHTNYQAKVDAQIQTISNNVIDAAWRQTNLQLANKAPKNWGSVTSAGQKAPNNTVWMTEPNTVFAGGTEYAHVAVGIGTICVLTDKGAPVYTEGSEGQFRFKDDSGQHYFGFDIRESYTIGCRTDGISVNNNMVTLTYDLTSADNPEILTCTNLNTGTWSPVTVTWETNPPVAGTKICYINVGSNPQGFYKAQMSYAGGSKFVTNMMADFTGGIAATNETGISTATQVPIYPAATPTGVVWRVMLGN